MNLSLFSCGDSLARRTYVVADCVSFAAVQAPPLIHFRRSSFSNCKRFAGLQFVGDGGCGFAYRATGERRTEKMDITGCRRGQRLDDPKNTFGGRSIYSADRRIRYAPACAEARYNALRHFNMPAGVRGRGGRRGAMWASSNINGTMWASSPTDGGYAGGASPPYAEKPSKEVAVSAVRPRGGARRRLAAAVGAAGDPHG